MMKTIADGDNAGSGSDAESVDVASVELRVAQTVATELGWCIEVCSYVAVWGMTPTFSAEAKCTNKSV